MIKGKAFYITSLLILSLATFNCRVKKGGGGNAQSTKKDIESDLATGLWAYYPLNGDTEDKSGNNRSLTLKRGARLNIDSTNKNIAAIDFDGIDDYGIIEDGALFEGSAFSISLLVLPRENKGLFFGKQDYNTGKGASFNVGIDVPSYGNVARFSITENQSEICSADPTAGLVVLNNHTLNTNEWHHLATTFRAGIMKFYINGDLIGTRKIDITQINNCQNGRFILGSWWERDHNAFNGKMDDIRIFTRAISPKEVKHLFKSSQQVATKL